MAHFGHHLLTALPNPLLPAIRTEFGLSYTQASFIPLSFALAGGAAQIPSGRLADRINPAILIAVGTLGVAVAGILVGLSRTYIMLIVLLVVMGLMTGGYHPASTPLILSSVEPKVRGRALGLHLLGGNSSFFVSPIIAGLLMTTLPGWTWRGPFFVLAVPTAIFGLIFYIYLTRKGGKGHAEKARQRMAGENPPQPGYRRRLIAYLVMMVLGGGASASLIPLLTLFMVDSLGASDARAASIMSIMYLPGVFGGPIIGGLISDRIGSVRVVIATNIISGLIIYGLTSVSLGFSLYAVLFVMGLNMAIRMPVTEVFIMSQTPVSNRSTIYGIYYFTMQYTGAIFAPIIAWFSERFGFLSVFTYLALVIVVVAVTTSFFIWDAKDNYSAVTPAGMAK
jgi:MFS family permease